ncbi:helix-turn-helix domain-containing protein [Acetobacter tropicalis]|nr:hypothetical protein [Acetobacter tropicalis]KXV52597.1 hypothetical protein AD944_00730 [Acetobacter tropicalis]
MTKKEALCIKTDKFSVKKLSASPITQEDRGYARAAVRLTVARAIWTLWDSMRENEGVDQAWLVERLDSNKGRVSRLLNSPGNWTLDTIADLLEAMEARLTLVRVERYQEIDTDSTVRPSLAGMRDHPRLWNVVAHSFENNEKINNVETAMVNRTISTTLSSDLV